ncbi:hypothetical protein GGR51DRAFT_509971 [Nemania sp. FL0031]|nr:hypothetical protein GGR51DRAFT_509971 [Nemania sp. FL0031]
MTSLGKSPRDDTGNANVNVNETGIVSASGIAHVNGIAKETVNENENSATVNANANSNTNANESGIEIGSGSGSDHRELRSTIARRNLHALQRMKIPLYPHGLWRRAKAAPQHDPRPTATGSHRRPLTSCVLRMPKMNLIDTPRGARSASGYAMLRRRSERRVLAGSGPSSRRSSRRVGASSTNLGGRQIGQIKLARLRDEEKMREI